MLYLVTFVDPATRQAPTSPVVCRTSDDVRDFIEHNPSPQRVFTITGVDYYTPVIDNNEVVPTA